MWEIPALAIINELRSRSVMKTMCRFELDVLYARAKAKLWSKVERLRAFPDIKIADFGNPPPPLASLAGLVRQRAEGRARPGLHRHLQRAAGHEERSRGDRHQRHELPMAMVALADTEDEMRQAPYRVLLDWQKPYDGNLLVVLPDAFGTASFPARRAGLGGRSKGFRLDSAEPVEGGEEIIAWWKSKGRDPRDKLIVFPTASTSRRSSASTPTRPRAHEFLCRGTNLTNDFQDCAPQPTDDFDAISLACKVTQVNGRPAVKLSDNPEKATGDPAEIARYLRVFGEAGRTGRPVLV